MDELKEKIKDCIRTFYPLDYQKEVDYTVQTSYGPLTSDSIIVNFPGVGTEMPYLSANENVFVYLYNKNNIPKEIKRDKTIIYTSKQEPALRNCWMIWDTICTLAALTGLELGSRDMIDFGSGAGILSLYGKRNGINKVVAIEKKSELMINVDEIIRENYMKKDDFTIIKKNITPFWPKNKFAAQELNELISPGSVAVVNLGNCEGYEKVNQKALDLVKKMPNISTLVNGGYRNNTEEIKTDLMSAGFSFTNMIKYRNAEIAFVAQR